MGLFSSSKKSRHSRDVTSHHRPIPKSSAPPPPPKPREGKIRVHFVRHAEAWHNTYEHNANRIVDPGLTRPGEEHCFELGLVLRSLKPDNILCSPMRRTLETAIYSLGMNAKIVAYSDLRELGSGPNSTGTKLEKLTSQFKRYKELDFSKVSSGWEINKEKRTDIKNGKKYRSKDIDDRAERVRKEIWELAQKRPDKTKDYKIIVFSHGDFLRVLTRKNFNNCQVRTLNMVKTDKGLEFRGPSHRYHDRL